MATRPLATEVDSARGWLTVAAAFVSMAVVFGVAYSFGAFFAPMAAEFGTGSGATSIVFSFTAFCWFALGSVSGRAVDRFGPRPVLLVGAAALAAGLVTTSWVAHLWVGYLTYGLGVGIAVACGYVPMVAVVGGWFDRRRGVALAVAVAGIGVGTLAGAPVAAALIDAYGWRRTNVIFAIGGTLLLVACAVVARRPPEPQGDSPLPVRALVRTPAFRSLYASTLLASLALFVPFVFLPAFAVEAGVDPVPAATIVGVIGVASVVGRLAIGALADRIGRIRTYQVSYATLAVSFLAWLAAASVGRAWTLPLLLVFAIVLGIGYGGWIALQPTVVAELFGLRGLGGLVGLIYTAGGIGALLGPPLAGLVIDTTGGYRWSVAGAMLCGVGAFLALLPLNRGEFHRSR
ncbi:MFS transporter [Pseudonocardia acidicola]|uniref:MFS transporter n=1 Tax=Pseudonocardia acidicola TaxID=2724939 RepID=A0ABX1S7C8_9PSEU|nr:MFS transporter [Pseudonocardia acidicola]NMH96712.1 MFS transporter [Pseudonocardia acidicola]